MNVLQLVADTLVIVIIPLLIWNMIDLRRMIRRWREENERDASVTVSADKSPANGDKSVAKTRQETS